VAGDGFGHSDGAAIDPSRHIPARRNTRRRTTRRYIVHASVIGLFVGILLGFALILEEFGAMLIVALLGIVGFIVGRVLAGELDLTQYLGGRRR
jgi:hypothetical protein